MRGRPDTHTLKMESDTVYENIFLNGTKDAETIKGSNIQNAVLKKFDIIGGYEDCIDCVRGNNYVFEEGILRTSPKTRVFITLKGGIDGVEMKNLLLIGRTKFPWDISLGDHTIYNKGRLMNQKNILISDVSRYDKKPVRILVMDSARPEVRDSRVRFIRIPKPIVRVWFMILR